MGQLTAYLCSRNAHKARELATILTGWRIEVLDADGYPDEDGESYRENARGKALHGRPLVPVDAWVIGEDSGIEAAALDGAPGIHSARWADDPVGALLGAVGDAGDRRARYVCSLVAISGSGREVAVEETLEGTLSAAPSGSEGFGYDPIFVPLGEEVTVAVLGDAWKAEHSHRARAARALRDALALVAPSVPATS